MAVTAAVIGCGGIAKFHFAGLEKAGARVRYVCDLAPDRAQPWAERFGARFAADYAEPFADPEVDMAVVTTVSSAHKRICAAAIDAGKAVICEKTLAENANDALAIVRRAERRGTVFFTSYMKRFIPAVRKANALLPSLGRILSTHVRAYQPWGDLWSAAPAKGLFHTPASDRSQVVKNYGGGILTCGGSHILDLILFLLGRPSRLFATLHVPDGRDYDLQAAALMQTENGVVHFEALAHPLRRVGFLKDGWDERIEINGLNGRLELYSALWDAVDTKASMLVHYNNTTGRTRTYRFKPVSPFERAIAFFCRSVDNGCQAGQSRWTGYEVDELIAHIKRSAASGRAVRVNWRGGENGEIDSSGL
ncbi:MAG: Gfo/Idh/MocA family oxidoreductase [Kiritimatiellae bacterium]|nr:Gfo/Idh/MocA family oxidoreductase [Kiritimatiellia bacterium]